MPLRTPKDAPLERRTCPRHPCPGPEPLRRRLVVVTVRGSRNARADPHPGTQIPRTPSVGRRRAARRLRWRRTSAPTTAEHADRLETVRTAPPSHTAGSQQVLSFRCDAAVVAGERLLLVDDEENLRSMLEAALRHLGFDVQTAATGREALAAAVNRPAGGDRPRRDAARPRRLRGVPAAAHRGQPHAGRLPDRSRRHGGQGPRTHARRRRLPRQAVQPRRARRPRAGGPPPLRPRPTRRAAAVRRPRDGRRRAPCAAGRHRGAALADRVQPAALPPRSTRAAFCRSRRSSTTSGSTTSVATAASSRPTSATSAARSTRSSRASSTRFEASATPCGRADGARCPSAPGCSSAWRLWVSCSSWPRSSSRGAPRRISSSAVDAATRRRQPSVQGGGFEHGGPLGGQARATERPGPRHVALRRRGRRTATWSIATPAFRRRQGRAAARRRCDQAVDSARHSGDGTVHGRHRSAFGDPVSRPRAAVARRRPSTSSRRSRWRTSTRR